jgi:hypothetical protein
MASAQPCRRRPVRVMPPRSREVAVAGYPRRPRGPLTSGDRQVALPAAGYWGRITRQLLVAVT